MIRTLAMVESKFKRIIEAIGIMIYINCDKSTQYLLTLVGKNGSLNLEGDEEGKERRILIHKILDIIAQDTQEERIIRKLK